jgi:copper(I)-binding protein
MGPPVTTVRTGAPRLRGRGLRACADGRGVTCVRYGGPPHIAARPLATLLSVIAQPGRRLRSQLVALLAGSALLIAGCGTGQRAQTAVEVPVVDGVQADVGALNLRAVTVVTPPGGSYAKGGNAALQLYIVNNGAVDRLVSVSSPAAKSATVSENQLSAIQAAELASIPSASPSASASASASAGFSVALASGETTAIGATASQPQITLLGLTAPLYPAMSIPITFTFANAGPVTVDVSVHLSTGGVDAPTLAVTHSSASQ